MDAEKGRKTGIEENLLHIIRKVGSFSSFNFCSSNSFFEFFTRYRSSWKSENCLLEIKLVLIGQTQKRQLPEPFLWVAFPRGYGPGIVGFQIRPSVNKTWHCLLSIHPFQIYQMRLTLVLKFFMSADYWICPSNFLELIDLVKMDFATHAICAVRPISTSLFQ